MNLALTAMLPMVIRIPALPRLRSCCSGFMVHSLAAVQMAINAPELLLLCWKWFLLLGISKINLEFFFFQKLMEKWLVPLIKYFLKVEIWLLWSKWPAVSSSSWFCDWICTLSLSFPYVMMTSACINCHRV